MEINEGKKHRRKKAALIILLVFLILILSVVAGAVAYVNYLLGNMNYVSPDSEYTLSASEADDYLYNDPEMETADPEETYVKIEDILFPEPETDPTEATDAATNPAETVPSQTNPTENTSDNVSSNIYGDHLVNIMLVGQDREEGESRQRSDTMILVSFNKSDNTITLTSFMRDQYVQIPGYKPNKLNAAYAYGGMSLLTRTLELNFGVKLDGMVEVDFSGFIKVIDLLGGVDITLTKAEAGYLNTLYEIGTLSSPVVVGQNHLDAKQAFVFASLREIDTDYARARRQRAVITGLIEAYKNLPLDQMLGLLDDILPMITTNMTNSQIMGYAMELFPMLATANVNTLRIPLDGTFDSGRAEVREGFTAWFQYNIDFYENQKALWEIFRNKS